MYPMQIWKAIFTSLKVAISGLYQKQGTSPAHSYYAQNGQGYHPPLMLLPSQRKMGNSISSKVSYICLPGTAKGLGGGTTS